MVSLAEFDGATAFDVDVGPNRVVFGGGVLEQLGSLAFSLGSSRPLLVTDPGLAATAHVERAVASLGAAGLVVAVFADVAENPTDRHVARGVEAAVAHRADLLIGLGGGSAMDCAKGINFVVAGGGRIQDYRGHDLAKGTLLPSIGIPTTAGTGSEAQSFALISDSVTHHKLACGDRQARFRIVVLDPDLLATVPPRVAAVTGLDALGHAVESFVTTRRNPLSCLYAKAAFDLLEGSFADALRPDASVATRGRMQLGAYLAGCAIEASMLGAAHACANPLTAHFDVPHGVAVALMLPHVVRCNASVVEAAYASLAPQCGSGERLARRLEQLRELGGLPATLSTCGVQLTDLPTLAAEAAEQWTGSFNPRPLTVADFAGLYELAL